jgi:hypothetical protein
MFRTLGLLSLLLLAVPGSVRGQDGPHLDFGGDQYAAGQAVNVAAAVSNDAFLAGSSVNLASPVGGSAYLFGMTVTSSGAIEHDLHAAGFNVNVTGPIGGSLSAAGNTVAVRAPARIGGNARLAGASVTLSAASEHAVLVSAKSLALDAPIGGDLSFFGETITFGPQAKVGGDLLIQAPNPIEVPASVAPSERVKFRQVASPDYATQAGGAAAGVLGSFWPGLWAAVGWWAFLVIVGGLFIALAPRLTTAVGAAAANRPWRLLGLGLLGLAAAVGLVPVAAVSVIGLLLVPFILLFAVLLCMAGYLAGVFVLGEKVGARLMPAATTGRRVLVLAAALLAAAVLGAIPFLGWLISFLLTVFGVGTLVEAMMARRTSVAADRRAAVASPVT